MWLLYALIMWKFPEQCQAIVTTKQMLANIINWHLLDSIETFEYLIIGYPPSWLICCCCHYSSEIIFSSYLKNTLKIFFCKGLLTNSLFFTTWKCLHSTLFIVCYSILSPSMKFCFGRNFLSFQRRNHSTSFSLPMLSTSQIVPILENVSHI